jgi:Mg-chelatase subunit ChlI
LLDRFGLSVSVVGEREPERRMMVLESRLLYESDPETFFTKAEPEQEALRQRIAKAQELLSSVVYTRKILEQIAKLCIEMDVDGHRADITMLKTAITLAAFNGRTETTEEDVREAANLTLPHRRRCRFD